MIRILAVGNVRMGDDAFGPAVVRAFEAEYDFGSDIEVVDVGTPTLDVTPWLAEAERVIIVDTVHTGQVPGTLDLYDKHELLRHPPLVRVDPHHGGVKDALLALEVAECGPAEVVLIGIVPGRVGVGLDLTPAVADMVPAAVTLLVEMLRSFGATMIRRKPAKAQRRLSVLASPYVFH
jgi:hydrogenase maturation protease